MTEEERRQRRHELAQQFAEEVATWSSHKLRAAYAQPEKVRAAEERERREALERSQTPPST